MTTPFKSTEFKDWWAKQPKGDPTNPVSPQQIWEAATRIEREACAQMVQLRSTLINSHATIADDPEERTQLKSLAWQFSAMADRILMRGK